MKYKKISKLNFKKKVLWSKYLMKVQNQLKKKFQEEDLKVIFSDI